ncbi:MAG: hypothetical protein PVH17_07705 [Anaerolineae bacterium]|jgi:chromosome segregation ATPase
MDEERIQATLEREASPGLDRIRDILFGFHLQQLEQEFEAIRRELGRLQQEIDHLSEQVSEQENTQGKKLQALGREVRQTDDNLRSELRQRSQELDADKVEQVELGQLFLQIGSHMTEGGSISDLLKRLAAEEPDPGREE